ncbi:MAG: protein kinase [Polyangiaceae bacterium]
MAQASQVGPYCLLETLGQGGMGVVFRARHSNSEKIVALKTVSVEAPAWIDCIRREIRALTYIRHPGVVRILDDGTHEGRPWYAMELLEGETLRNYLQRTWSPYRVAPSRPPPSGRLSHTEPEPGVAIAHLRSERQSVLPHASLSIPAAGGHLTTTLRICRRICATLAFLHGEGFINCDLKPENILLVNGDPILIDFGLIAQNMPRETLDYGRMMAGTLPYMSPEQLRGEFVDARSDLYSLGCMLYELLVGTPPFTGPPAAVRAQHLISLPAVPSARVSGVPPALDQLTLALIEKDLSRRAGFADEVAARLAGLSGEEPELPDFPATRPYLYRPRFVGREEVVARLCAARDRAANGDGAFVVLLGESGVGKTRVAMEMTRLTPSSMMQTITSDTSPLSAAAATSISRAPLHSLRPVLRAVAHRCQLGGPEVTERLLGLGLPVLSRYEPLLAAVPAYDSPGSVIPLSPAAARRQLFECLESTLAALAAELPLLWIIDDVGWADELSLAFLESLAPAFFRRTPILVLCTNRSEEGSEQLASLMRLPHVEQHRLSRLTPEAVQSMVGDMLALSDPLKPLVNFVTAQAEGNPFFVAEYLRAAVGEGLLDRGDGDRWRLTPEPSWRDDGLQRLELPVSLRALIDQRFRRLSPKALLTAIAAAAIGRETDTDTLSATAALDDDSLLRTVDELLKHEVLELSEAGRVRFAHDKLREIAYGLAERPHRTALHARAASAIESRYRGHANPERIWPTLGHHFGAAELHEPGAKYLKLAADHARSTYANEQAIRLYRDAISEALAARSMSQGDRWDGILAELHEGLADVLTLTGERGSARTAYALALESSSRAMVRARVLRKIGKTWEIEHQHERALAHYRQARAGLAGPLESMDAEERNEFVQAHIEELWVYYWLARVGDMDATASAIESVIREHGSSSQRSRFFQMRALAHMRRDRYVIRDETLDLARSAVEACSEHGGLAELPMAQHILGFALLFASRLDAAHSELSRAEALARRCGDAGHLARVLTYLTAVARLRGRVVETEAHASEGERVARSANIREYVAAAIANKAWLAQRRGSPEDGEALAREALAIWADLELVFPFQSLALIPLLRAALARRDLHEAVSFARAIMAPSQQLPCREVADALKRAETLCQQNQTTEAEIALRAALKDLDPGWEAA